MIMAGLSAYSSRKINTFLPYKRFRSLDNFLVTFDISDLSRWKGLYKSPRFSYCLENSIPYKSTFEIPSAKPLSVPQSHLPMYVPLILTKFLISY